MQIEAPHELDGRLRSHAANADADAQNRQAQKAKTPQRRFGHVNDHLAFGGVYADAIGSNVERSTPAGASQPPEQFLPGATHFAIDHDLAICGVFPGGVQAWAVAQGTNLRRSEARSPGRHPG
jgi:hypothetical protein